MQGVGLYFIYDVIDFVMIDYVCFVMFFQVVVLQMVSMLDVICNFVEVCCLIVEVVGEGVQFVLLFEYFCFMGYCDIDKFVFVELYWDGLIQQFFVDVVCCYGIWVIGGMLLLKVFEFDCVLNMMFVFDLFGNEVVCYDKIYLFNFEKGDELFDEVCMICVGDMVVVFDVLFGQVGLLVCYDFCFLELYCCMGDCVLMVVLLVFMYMMGCVYWEMLLCVWVVENQCYVFVAVQGGKYENGWCMWGYSMLIDLWGEIVVVCDEGVSVVFGVIDL